MGRTAVQTILALVICSAAWAADVPVAVSPGDASNLALIEGRCPTFSWGALPGAESYELVVYRGDETRKEASPPVLRQSIAGSALSWTPPLARCLERGGQYAWMVRAVGEKSASRWSPPRLFEVASGPSEAEFEEAVQVVLSYLGARGDAVPEAATAGPAKAPAAGNGVSGESPNPSGVAPAGTQLTVDGNVDAVSFSGGGAMLTAIDPANLAAGMAGIDVSGNAATAADADTVDGVHAAALEESAEIDDDIAVHAALPNIHHTGDRGHRHAFPHSRNRLHGIDRWSR